LPRLQDRWAGCSKVPSKVAMRRQTRGQRRTNAQVTKESRGELGQEPELDEQVASGPPVHREEKTNNWQPDA
jgi:hypothetical protein